MKGNLTPGFPFRSTAIIPIPENLSGMGTSFRRNDFWDHLVEQAPLLYIIAQPVILRSSKSHYPGQPPANEPSPIEQYPCGTR